MLSGHGLAVQCSPGMHGRMFDFLAFIEDRLALSEVNARRRQIVQALMISPCVVMADELLDALFQLARQIAIAEQDLVL